MPGADRAGRLRRASGPRPSSTSAPRRARIARVRQRALQSGNRSLASRSCRAARICDLIRSSSDKLNSIPLFVARAMPPLIVKSASSNCPVLRRPSANAPMKPVIRRSGTVERAGFPVRSVANRDRLPARRGRWQVRLLAQCRQSTVRLQRVSSGVYDHLLDEVAGYSSNHRSTVRHRRGSTSARCYRNRLFLGSTLRRITCCAVVSARSEKPRSHKT